MSQVVQSEERDPVADMAVCEAATDGPWSFFDAYRNPRDAGLVNAARLGRSDYTTVIRSTEGRDIELRREDAAFIALARTALPFWITKAQSLAAERDRLRGFMDDLSGFDCENESWQKEGSCGRCIPCRARKALSPNGTGGE